MDLTLVAMAIFVVVFTATAMVMDVRSLRVPNWLNVGSLVLAVTFHLATGGLSGLVHAAGGFAVGFGILFVLWLIGGGGGGDVKLMGALGAWLGAPLTMLVFLASTVFGVLAHLAIIAYGAMAGTSAAYAGAGASGGGGGRSTKTRRRIPYAVPVALATWSLLALKLLSMSTQ